MNYRSKYHLFLLWQFFFIILSLSWLWAPWLNPSLSAHTSAISQFEATNQPYSIVFRICDILSAILLIGAGVYFATKLSKHRSYFVVCMLLLVGIGMLLDPLFPTQCLQLHHYCVPDASSPLTFIHNYESSIVYGILLLLVSYDAVKRRKIPSITTAAVHTLFGLYIILNIPSLERYATISQFVYQFTVTLWLAWFCREITISHAPHDKRRFTSVIRYAMVTWTFLMGVTAILLGLTGGRFVGRAPALYLGDGAWLAQHGVIIGVILLYIGRHLLRGELRARQIILAIFGIEIITYATVTPHPSLLYLYLIGFTTLFVLHDSFDRGTAPLTWRIRLRDVGYLLAGLVVSGGLAALIIAHRHEASQVVTHAFAHLGEIVFRNTTAPLAFRRPEIIFSDTISALIIAVIIGIIWALFRPSARPSLASNQERRDAKTILQKNSHSSEDYFKLWPQDKSYFWDDTSNTFLAYRQVNAVAYLLADPIGKRPDALLGSFIRYCRTERLKLACLPVYESSRHLYESHGLACLQIGASAVITIATFTETTAHDKWWRWQRNRAEKKGYKHHVSTPPHSTKFLQQCEAISNRWLDDGNHIERGFTLGYFDTTYMNDCVIHYLSDESNTPVAFVNILPSFRALQTSTIDLLRFLPDHNGTMPYLLYCVITSLATKKNVAFFDLGFVPFASTDNRIVQVAKLIGGKRFSSKGLEQFKNKFDPTWEPNYLAYDGDLGDLGQIATNLEKAMRVKEEGN